MGADSWDSTRHRATFNDVTNYNQRVATTSAVSLTPLVCLEGVYIYYTTFRMVYWPGTASTVSQ